MRTVSWIGLSAVALVAPLVVGNAAATPVEVASHGGVASPLGATSRGAAVEPRTLLAVGDIACDPTSPYVDSPGLCQQDRVGELVRQKVRAGADWFVPLGDVQYERGGYRAFVKVYDRAFGRVRSVTQAIAGNHEYLTSGARGYFRYFKKRAGDRNRPWRTFIAAPGWRVVLLDSNCEYVGGCGRDSRQWQWLRRTLADAAQPCVIAAWHHPLRTSGEYAGNEDSSARARKLWRVADNGGVDIVLNGHDHIYERFAKRGGIQQFTVGTGGKNHYEITTKAKGSKKRIGHRYGVLQLRLFADGSYRHAFLTVGGEAKDRGSGRCTNSA